ncbi:MAG: putative large exoprotein, partial [Hyphomicrobiales bacterium]|nr:putative large exoprotein [Hyphomicrobiales bacterium]
MVSGAAVITTPNPSLLQVNQASQNAIIDWRSFSVGAGETARFAVPAGGSTLNRVTGADPSAIYGSLSSNGRLFLVNPNGIVVGPTGVIDTAGLVLSTHSVKDAEFLAGGAMTFSGPSTASVVNSGVIRSTGGGDVFLIARQVENRGSISAPGGTVGLAGGTEILITASDSGDGRVAVRSGPGKVVNSGTIAAAQAELRAAGGNHYALAINNTGVVRATGVATRGGRVFLTAGSGSISSSGKISARNADGSGGRVRVATAPRPAAVATRRAAAERNVVDITGTVDVSASSGAGGSIVLEGEAISLGASARLDASGPSGGGRIVIGGGFGGKDASIVNADDVLVVSGAQIVADATGKGDGGQVSIWADGATTFHGAISARGGSQGGDGGFAEVSGKESVTVSGHADMRATLGAHGTLLIDPGSIAIQDGPNAAVDANTFNDAYLETQLGLGNVTLQTAAATNAAAENITVKNGVSIVWNGPTLLSLRAGADIVVENNVVISNTQTGDGAITFVQKDAGGVELLAGKDITAGALANAGAIRIGSEFGVTRLVAGDANFNGRPDAPGTGKISLIGGGADGAHVQIGYRQPLARGNDTGADFASPSLHAENGTISVHAGGDVTLTGGSMKGSFVQIGHGGLAATSTSEILRSDVHVISSGGSVKLGSLGVESAFAKIGHGSYLEDTDSASYALGRISGDIHVNALTSVALNGATVPDADKVAENGVADVFMARIGHGAHVQGESSALKVTTGDMSGAITIGARTGALLAPATPLLLVQLGASISPTDKDDARQVSSQIGHGSDVRIVPTQIGGSADVTLGGVRPFLDINGVKTAAADITVKADEIALNSIIAGPKNGL